MTIRISRELPLFNFERLDILCPRIGHPCENCNIYCVLNSPNLCFSSCSCLNTLSSSGNADVSSSSRMSKASCFKITDDCKEVNWKYLQLNQGEGEGERMMRVILVIVPDCPFVSATAILLFLPTNEPKAIQFFHLPSQVL